MLSITSTQDPATNTSAVRSILRIINGSYVADDAMQVGLVVQGVQAYWWQGRADYPSGTLVLADVTRTVTHNAAGEGSVTVVGAVYASATGFVNLSINVNNLTLPTIPRATTPNWAADFVAGSAQTINLPRASSAFTHDVSYTFGAASGVIATGAGVTTSWTPALSLLSEIPNAVSGAGTITVVTKSGSTVIGTKSVPFTLGAGAGVVPTVSAVAWDDANATVKTNIGAFVQGLSLVKGTVTAAGVYGSTITEKRLRIGSTLIPENTPFQVAGSGSVSAVGEAVDSRGRVGTLSAPFTVLAYAPPTLGSGGWQVRRSDASSTPTDTGEHLLVNLHAIAASLKPAATEKNLLTVTVRTRPVGGSWTTRNTFTSGLLYNSAFLVSGGAVFLATTSYEVEVALSDKTGIEATRIVTTIPTATVTLDLNGTKVGVGKYWEQGALDVGGDIYANGVKVSVEGHAHAAADITSGTIATARLPTASESARGAVERATQAEVDAGTDTTRYVSPATLRSLGYRAYAEAAGQVTTVTSGLTTVTLPVGRFGVAPRVRGEVIVHPNVCVTHIRSLSSTSFNVAAYTIGGAIVAATVDWHAVQMTSSDASG